MELDYEYELLANEARPEGRKRLGSKPLQVAWIRSFDLPIKEFLFLDKETQQELVEKVPSFKEFGGNRDDVELKQCSLQILLLLNRKRSECSALTTAEPKSPAERSETLSVVLQIHDESSGSYCF